LNPRPFGLQHSELTNYFVFDLWAEARKKGTAGNKFGTYFPSHSPRERLLRPSGARKSEGDPSQPVTLPLIVTVLSHHETSRRLVRSKFLYVQNL
jgi:hypothetical protein